VEFFLLNLVQNYDVRSLKNINIIKSKRTQNTLKKKKKEEAKTLHATIKLPTITKF
jgi:hypothetical protein